MKKILLTLFAALAFCGSISAQFESLWEGEFDPWNNNPYEEQKPLVAFIQIDGNSVSEQDNWEALEVAYFVDGVCRGHDFLADHTDEGDPYPILEGSIYYDLDANDEGKEVTFKMYNHVTGDLYETCLVLYWGEPLTILTGDEHVEIYFDYNEFDYDEAVVLNFISPEPPAPSCPWDEYDYDYFSDNFDDQRGLVAAIMIDGEIIDLNYENWNALEVAAFVDDECRGNEMYLTDEFVNEYGDPYLTLDNYANGGACSIYYNGDGGEPVSFKMYDHQNNVLYENCEVLYLDEPKEIFTGEDYMEGWDDFENPIFLNFITFDGLVLANDDSENDPDNAGLIEENIDTSEPIDVKLKGRTLYRNQNWNTLCLPFDVEEFGGTPLEGATVMELDLDGKYNADGESDEAGTYQTGFDATDGTLYLYFTEAEEIEAGKPYIVKWEDEDLENITDPVFYGVTIDATDPTAITFAENKVQFIGTYSYSEYTDENKYVLLLGSDSNLFYPDGNEATTVGAFRAYFQLQNGLKAGEPDQSDPTGGIKNFVLNFGDGETGIRTTNLTNLTNEAGAWYDLSGRRLSGKPTQKGIYINNNKKSFIK